MRRDLLQNRQHSAFHTEGWLALIAVLMLAGCAAPTYVMKYDPQGYPVTNRPVWPSAPETPRYIYGGQLRGESNFFVDENSQAKSTMSRVLAFLVGLDEETDSPFELYRPQGIYSTSDDVYFVTDVGRRGVFVFNAQNGSLGFWGLAAPGVRFESPVGVSAGPDGEILVADSELGYVARLNSSGQPIGRIGAASMIRPTGLAWDGAREILYVSDTGKHDIKVFDGVGNLIETFGSRGTEAGQFNFPTYIAFANNRLYVTDTMNARIQVLDDSGEPLKVFGDFGVYKGNLVRPKGIGVDTDGNIYVVESFYDHLLVFDQEGRYLLGIGGEGSDIGRFYLPAGLHVDERNRVWVADLMNGRVVLFQFLGGDG